MAWHLVQHLAESRAHPVVLVPGEKASWFPLLQLAHSWVGGDCPMWGRRFLRVTGVVSWVCLRFVFSRFGVRGVKTLLFGMSIFVQPARGDFHQQRVVRPAGARNLVSDLLPVPRVARKISLSFIFAGSAVDSRFLLSPPSQLVPHSSSSNRTAVQYAHTAGRPAVIVT